MAVAAITGSTTTTNPSRGRLVIAQVAAMSATTSGTSSSGLEPG
ncbi:MAG: hypothetical protein ACRDO2_01370 [Nocardioidaceae bacterium]